MHDPPDAIDLMWFALRPHETVPKGEEILENRKEQGSHGPYRSRDRGLGRLTQHFPIPQWDLRSVQVRLNSSRLSIGRWMIPLSGTASLKRAGQVGLLKPSFLAGD